MNYLERRDYYCITISFDTQTILWTRSTSPTSTALAAAALAGTPSSSAAFGAATLSATETLTATALRCTSARAIAGGADSHGCAAAMRNEVPTGTIVAHIKEGVAITGEIVGASGATGIKQLHELH